MTTTNSVSRVYVFPYLEDVFLFVWYTTPLSLNDEFQDDVKRNVGEW